MYILWISTPRERASGLSVFPQEKRNPASRTQMNSCQSGRPSTGKPCLGGTMLLATL